MDLAGFCLCLESARTLKVVKRFTVYGKICIGPMYVCMELSN